MNHEVLMFSYWRKVNVKLLSKYTEVCKGVVYTMSDMLETAVVVECDIDILYGKF